MQILCEYAEEKKTGNGIYLWCKKNDSYCAFQRYCVEHKCLKMISSYTNSKGRLKNNEEKEN